MLTTITEASEHFCTHQLRSSCTIEDGISQHDTFIAYIDIDTNAGSRYRIYVASDKNFIQKVATIFLEEDGWEDIYFF